MVDVAEFRGFLVKSRRNDEFGSREDRDARGGRVEDGAGPDHVFRLLVFREGADDVFGARDGEGDLEPDDAAFRDRVTELLGFVEGIGADDGDDAAPDERLDDFELFHG